MTESIEKTKESLEEKQVEENDIRYKIHPRKYFNYDCETNDWSLEIHLPGVEKSQIKFKILPTFYDLEARREHALYSSTSYFPWEIDTESIEAKYESGLLIVKGKIRDPLDKSYSIQLD